MLQNPLAAQQKVQRDIFRRLVQSSYGKSLGIKSIDDWCSIPIIEYQDIEEWIGDRLTSEPIIFYEKTSGSRGKAKLIPYTKSLRRSFNQMFCVWAHDLIVNGPKFSQGKLYFCISPQFTTNTHVAHLQDDSEYLDGWLRSILSNFFVSPPGINRVSDPEEFKHKLALALLQEENLEIISVWSPTFLKVILDYIQTHRQKLAIELKNHISPQRHQRLMDCDTGFDPRLWPQLKLISCWDSANAADSAGFLRSLFPGVLVQGKGLLATEAPMTIPLIKAGGCVPVLDEVFFEFEDEAGKIHLLNELTKGSIYSIIISQKGGLYRYRIGDRVKVSHFYFNTPCLEFIGRDRSISDLVGEKLHSEFVIEVINTLPLGSTSFKSLVPVKSPPHYILLIDSAENAPEEIAQLLEEGLKEYHHYRQARLLGQLEPARVLISPHIPELMSLHKTKSGQKWGDIKHDILCTTPIQEELFVVVGCVETVHVGSLRVLKQHKQLRNPHTQFL